MDAGFFLRAANTTNRKHHSAVMMKQHKGKQVIKPDSASHTPLSDGLWHALNV